MAAMKKNGFNNKYITVTLPNILKPQKNFLLKRLGKDNDGGYLIDPKSLKISNTLISLGINDDWSFESDFFSKNSKINILCFDNNTSFLFLIKVLIKKIFKFYHYGILDICKSFLKIFNYFFFLKKYFFFKNITYNDLIKISKKVKAPFFIKIDIEGAEYRILDDLIKIQKKISGLVIEFHSVDLFMNKIKNFIKKFKLELIHIHPNNCGALHGEANVLELTFSKKPTIINKKVKLPNKLDQKNVQVLPEVKIAFI
jgi:hypothetical protein